MLALAASMRRGCRGLHCSAHLTQAELEIDGVPGPGQPSPHECGSGAAGLAGLQVGALPPLSWGLVAGSLTACTFSRVK